MARPRARTLPLLPFLLLPLAVGAPLSRAYAADVPITEEARTRFTAGVNLLKDPEGPRYEEAYREFKAAYAASPSYKILGNLGLCAMKLERDEEAINAYEKYLAEGEKLDPSEVAQVKTDLSTLKAGVVYLNITSNVPGAKIVDVRSPVRGEKVTNSYGPTSAKPLRIGVRQGQHVITAKLEGYPDAVWEIETGSSEVPLHTFEFKKSETPAPVVAAPTPVKAETTAVATRPVPTTVWIGVAATGAFTVGAVVTGILAGSKRSDYDAKNDGTDPAAAQSLKDSGESLNLINDVLVGGAVVAAGVTAVLYLTRPTVTEERPAASSDCISRLRVTPTVAARGGGGGLSVLGSF